VLQIFRVNHLVNSLLLFPYALVLNHRLFFSGMDEYRSQADGLTAAWLQDFNMQYPFWSVLFFVFILFVQALTINRISIVFRIGSEANLYPGMLYLLICSFFPAFQVLSGLLIGQMFFLIGLYHLFNTYKRHRDVGNLFNSAFWVGVASLFYIPFLIGVPLILFGGFILKSMKTRDFLLIINGILVPVFLVGTFFYLRGDLGLFVDYYFPPEMGFQFILLPDSIETLIPTMLMFVALIVALVNYQTYISKKGLRSKKNVEIIYILLLLQGLSTLFFPQIELQHMILMAIPLSLLLQDTLLKIDNQLTAEIIHLFLLSTLFFFQYQNIIEM